MEDRNTIMFNAAKTQQKSTREVLEAVYAALEERGYNGIDQMVGYILSGDPSYITGHNNARNLIRKVENAGDIRPLRFLDLVEQLPQVLGTGTHPHGVQPPVQHMRLDAGLVERLRPLTHGDVGVLPVQQIHLLKSSAVGLDAVETAHPDDGWGYFHELVHARLILTRALPHIPEYQAQFDFSCHSL